MPRFYFDFHEESGIARDDTGEELASVGAARNEAVATVVGMIKDSGARHSDTHFAIEVRDDFSAVLKVTASIQTQLCKR